MSERIDVSKVLQKMDFNPEEGDQITIIINRRRDETMSTYNFGFTALELLGVFTHRTHDIMRQISGEIVPDTVKVTRTAIVEEQANV